MDTFAKTFGGNIGDPVKDPYSVYAKLRREDPCKLFRGTMFGDMYFVTPYGAVRYIFENPRLFSSHVNDRLIGSLIGSTIVGLDEPDHNLMRKIIMPFFTQRPVGGLKERTRAIADEMIEQVGFESNEEGIKYEKRSRRLQKFPGEHICVL